MKKTHYLLVIAALALVVTIPAITKAEDSEDAQVNISATANTSGPVNTNVNLRDRLRADMQLKAQNIKNNQDVRNMMLQGRNRDDDSTTTGTSTIPGRGPKGDRGRGDDNHQGDERGSMMKQAFEMRKNNIIRELTQALNNLKQIRDRIASRITKAETSGRDMTKAKALLVTADAKVTLAQNAVNALNNVSLGTTTATTTASTTWDLHRPRLSAEAAIKALKDAKKALNEVVVAIAHAMGFKIGLDGSITGTSTATTTIPGGTGTTTSTTTGGTSTTTSTTTP